MTNDTPKLHPTSCTCVECRAARFIHTSIEDLKSTLRRAFDEVDSAVEADLLRSTIRRAIQMADCMGHATRVQVLAAVLCQLTPHPEGSERRKGKFRWVCMRCGNEKRCATPVRPNVACGRCGVRLPHRDYWSPVAEHQHLIPLSSPNGEAA